MIKCTFYNYLSNATRFVGKWKSGSGRKNE